MQTNKTLLFIIYLLCSISLSLNSQNNTFQLIIGGSEEESYPRVINSGDDNFLILNRTSSNTFGDVDVMLTKIDSSGKKLWCKNIGNSDRNYSKNIAKTDNGFIILSWNAGSYNIDDWCLIEINNSGDIIDHKYYGSDPDEEIHYLIPMLNGEYLIGSTIRESTTNVMYSLMDKKLQVHDSKTYMLNEADQCIRSASKDQEEYMVFCGYHNRKPFLQGVNKQGMVAFSKYIDLPGTSELREIALADDGEFLAVGFSNGINGDNYDILLTKVNKNGVVNWIKAIGMSGDDKAFDIKVKQNGNFIITGETSSYSSSKDIFMITIDSDGNFIDGHLYGGEEDEHYGFFDFTDNGGIIIVAEADRDNSENKDIFVVKTRADGSSCCSRDIDDIMVTNLQVGIQTLFPNMITNDVEEINKPFSIKTWQPELEYICYEPLRIEGPDELCKFSTNVEFTTDPQIQSGFISWITPQDAEIVTNMNDTAVWINFGEVPGYLYLYSNCNEENIDSLYIDLNGPDPSLGNDTVICKNESLLLTTEKNYLSYLWQDGSTDPYYNVDTSGIYWVEVTNSEDCSGIDSISVFLTEIPDIDLGPDTILITGEYYKLDAGPGFEDYVWTDFSTGQTLNAYKTGLYWVIGSVGDCSSSDTAYLLRNGCDILITNLLSPNDDAVGDEIFVINKQVISNMELTIFNLKGNKLYKTNDPNFKWDGSINGSILPNGIYLYTVNYYCYGYLSQQTKVGKIIIQR